MKKLKLKDLELKSFVTNLSTKNQNRLDGGVELGTARTEEPTCLSNTTGPCE